jgi:nicotinamide riboside transporter PnuC
MATLSCFLNSSGLNPYSIVATLLSMIGQFGVTYQKTWGLVIWILSNVVWIYVDIVIHPDLAQLSMYVFYAIMNTYSIIIWRRNDRMRLHTTS